MRSTSKTILFTRATRNGKSEQVPVAVFANEDGCVPFTKALFKAHKAGDVETLKGLDAAHLVSDDGKVATGLKFIRVTVPYAPDPTAADDDPFAEASSATS